MVGVCPGDIASGNIPKAASDLLSDLKRIDVAGEKETVRGANGVGPSQIMVRVGLSPFVLASKAGPPPGTPNADLFESNIYQGTAGIVLEVRPKIQQFSPSCIAVDFVEKQRGNWIEAWTGNSKDPNDRPKTKNNREFEWWIETGNHLWAFSSDIPADHTHSLYLSCRTLPHRVFVGSPSKLSLLPIQPTTNPSPATRP
jgi:hypothetical protein